MAFVIQESRLILFLLLLILVGDLICVDDRYIYNCSNKPYH
ncbi:hypothetical protein [Paramaledivibacter caminithermalis]|nr:hypothetical protein [Paramaledivibacter caminithermalis]